MEHQTITILGVCGSPRNSVTSQALDEALASAATVPGVEVCKIDLHGHDIQCCRNCNICIRQDCGSCPVIQDGMRPEYYELYRRCEGILLATPVYYMNATGLLHNFMSRMRPLSRYVRQGGFGGRMGGCIAAGGMRNGGQDFCLSALNNMLQATGTNIVGGGVQFYNGAAVHTQNQTALADEIGQQEARALGKKVAYLSKIICCGLGALGTDVSSANLLGFDSAAALADGYRLRGIE